MDLCRQCAVLPRGIHEQPDAEPSKIESVLVQIKGSTIQYFPIAYTLAFNADGSARHTAVLRERDRNAILHTKLEDVLET